MYLKSDKIVATIKNITFRSKKVSPYGQFVLDPTAMLGWTDGTAVRRDTTTRPVSSGDFTEPYTLSARLITFSGTAVAEGPGQLQQMRDSFVGALQNGEYTELSVETFAGVRYATVGLHGTPSWTQHTDTVASFKIDLYAPDPHVYGYERKTTVGATSLAGGGMKYMLSYPLNYMVENTNHYNTITNRGNTVAWPKFQVTGDYYAGFTLTDGRDRKVIYTGMVTSSSPVIIDMEKGTAIQNGTDKSVYLSERDWFYISPNEVMKPTFTPHQAASGWCDIMVRDTFI